VTITWSASGDREVELELQLMTEYTEKIRAILDSYRRQVSSGGKLVEGAGPDGIKEYFKMMMSSFEELARFVSPRIEHGKLHPLDKVNLILKLHEFEHELRMAGKILGR
jgi:hypothetical protein